MGDRDQLARDLVGCFPVLDKSDRTDAEATDGPTTAIGKLREAARLIRERAEATARPHHMYGDERMQRIETAEQWSAEVREYLGGDMGEHCASMHPAVALAVAGWLYSVAIDDEWEPETAPRIRERTAALAVARAYLGEEADCG